MSRSKLFVLPSEREGFSIATLEAQACGVPAIVARPTCNEVFGTSDFVKEGYNGEYYAVGNVVELSEVIHELLTNTGKIELYSNNAKSTAEHYDWDFIARDFEKSLRQRLNFD